MQKSQFLKAAEACVANGDRLLYDADWAFYEKHPAATSLTLAMIAQEEFAKAFLLLLVDKGVIRWNRFLRRATRDHICKQLVGLVLAYLAPEWDEEYRRNMEWVAEFKEHRRLMDEYDLSSDTGERARIWKEIQEISRK